ncbi:MAG: ABC transporter permease [Nanoarchaeota archaeon]|nr:ABC transporter permease [Nanoarchaeota archaeon]MBU0977135.1 ABC transporter permease [Nanoarchaeota archaeon]
MRIQKAFQLALNILLHSKLRSWLTIIGIVIGIAAVVSIVSISQGAQQQLESRLGNIGADIITVSPGASRAQGFGGGFREGPGGFGGDSSASSKQKNLTSKDVIVIRSLPNVKLVMGTVSGRGDLTYSSKTASVSVQGVDTLVWKEMTTETLDSGRFLTKGDSYAVVLGGRIVQNTFPDGIPLNSMVVIEGKSFKVVGILAEGNGVYMPIDIARTTLEDIGNTRLDSISVKVADVSLADDTVTLITQRLMMSRGILNDKDRDFTVTSQQTLQQNIQSTLNTMALFLGAIAAISLLVGAIGIANTMFTSVLEKTKEIGIMKAIGAKNRDILMIFLINSGMIGFVGGLGGIILGIFGSGLISYLGSSSTTTAAGGGLGRMFSSTTVTPSLLIAAMVFAVGIGMIAGAVPAYRASRLKPVDALRYE